MQKFEGGGKARESFILETASVPTLQSYSVYLLCVLSVNMARKILTQRIAAQFHDHMNENITSIENQLYELVKSDYFKGSYICEENIVYYHAMRSWD